MNSIQLLETGFIKELWNFKHEDEVYDEELLDSLSDYVEKNNIVSLSYHPHLSDYDSQFGAELEDEEFEFNEQADELSLENLTVYKLKDTDIYFAVMGGDWQTPANLVFKYSKNFGILPLLYFQNLHEQRD
jgi:hypothetical protein